MKVISPKNTFPNTAYVFSCKACKCIFAAEWKECYTEQKYDARMDLQYQIWRCKCPKCGKPANEVQV